MKNQSFEQRLMDFIQERFAHPNSKWEVLISEDTTDLWEGVEKKVKRHQSIYYHIEGLYDVHFVLEDTVMELDSSEHSEGEEWKEEKQFEKLPIPSFFDLVITNKKPDVIDHKIKHGLRLGNISWSPGYLFFETNGINEISFNFITQILKPFSRYFYLMDLLKYIVEIPYNDSKI